MTDRQITDKLKKLGFSNDAGATQLRHFSQTRRSSLVSNSVANRNNAGWGRAEYVIVKFENDNHSTAQLLQGWKRLASGYKNQYLILEEAANNWSLYDFSGEKLGGNEYIEKLFTSKQISSDFPILNITTALRTKPFLLLAGISGTGKSRIVKEMAFRSCPQLPALRKDPTSPGNYCLVEVKPNWHDSTELLGYEDVLNGGRYHVTPFVKFLAKAMMYPNVPFFVCLDEMNLAPVEQYFAEFLSVLESRKLVDGVITSEPLVKADFCRTLQVSDFFNIVQPKTQGYNTAGTSEDIEHYGKENNVLEAIKKDGLRLPPNVLVVGTVNMDETTHQFSRKVIDRAMTIEMNIEDGTKPFEDFFTQSRELDYEDEPLGKEIFLPSYASATDALSEADEEDQEFVRLEVPPVLADINTALKGTPFQIAYRVQNELVIYFAELRRENAETDRAELLTNAVDDILLMKVLPRIEGDKDLLTAPLNALHGFATDHRLNKSLNKIQEMQSRMENAQFVSFWP